MFEFFDFLTNFIGIIVDTVVKFFETLLFLITFMIQGSGYVQTCLLFLPSWVMPFVLAVVAFSVIMFLLGR